METRNARNTTDTEQSISLWYKCIGCQEFVFRGNLERNLYVCSYCGALFSLVAEKRLEHLLDEPSTAGTRATKHAGLAAEGTISGYPASLFIADIDVIPTEIDTSLLLTTVETALRKRLPLITIVACQPKEEQPASTEITYLTLQMERLADASLPHITVLTETERLLETHTQFPAPLSTYLPVGDVVIAEGTATPKNPTANGAPPTLQPALHAPEEQLLTQPSTSETEVTPDISVDCYSSREELPTLLGRFLNFFSGDGYLEEK